MSYLFSLESAGGGGAPSAGAAGGAGGEPRLEGKKRFEAAKTKLSSCAVPGPSSEAREDRSSCVRLSVLLLAVREVFVSGRRSFGVLVSSQL